VHFIKFGHDDRITPQNCRTGIHCVFIMTQPHGTVYAGVSQTLARKHNLSAYVPHIIKPIAPTRDLRGEWGIPADALVIGRHGGFETFDVPWVYAVLREALASRSDLYFVFLSTKPFCEHPRVRFIPWVESEQDKFNMIHSCDAMLHARLIGETFGIAVGEFSAANKPVITWTGRGLRTYDVAHIDILGEKALLYKDRGDLLNILLTMDRREIASRDWDVYSKRFSAGNVIRQYHDVFLKNGS
jgi:glycosyltransferase involved in cell wall biosynthesis